MRIFYDGFIYDFQRFGGINRYFSELISRLPPECCPLVSTYLGPNPAWPKHPQLRVVRSRPFKRAPALAHLGEAWLALQTASARADVFHPTYYQTLVPGGRGTPLVVTVHDMIHEIFAGQANLSDEVRQAKRLSIERADAILCNSEHTRRDLIERFPQAETKSFVTPLASSLSVDSAQARSTPGLEAPYFLYVGGRESYKNFGVMLTAWAAFAARHPEIRLRIVGSPWQADEQSRIAELRLENSIIHEGKAADERLAILYHRSLALVYPSLYEGFGIPPLEAMRCGTAVICSNSSSLPEVGGDAPLYFDPAEPEELLALMERLAKSPSERAAGIARGAARCRLFSWEKTGSLTVEIYRKVLSARK